MESVIQHNVKENFFSSDKKYSIEVSYKLEDKVEGGKEPVTRPNRWFVCADQQKDEIFSLLLLVVLSSHFSFLLLFFLKAHSPYLSSFLSSGSSSTSSNQTNARLLEEEGRRKWLNCEELKWD